MLPGGRTVARTTPAPRKGDFSFSPVLICTTVAASNYAWLIEYVWAILGFACYFRDPVLASLIRLIGNIESGC